MLFEPYRMGALTLRNRIVMAPLTRNRATAAHVPTPLMATYYAQRASMGLLITEGVAPAADGAGYARIPGLYSAEHINGWRRVTDAVHAAGGTIVVQLMHCGRVAHVDNLPPGARVVSSTTAPLRDTIVTDGAGALPASPPHRLDESEIAAVVDQYAQSARAAIEAGFDGIELHAANGYLIEQFLNPNINDREDGYGGTNVARNRFAIEVTAACVAAIGAERVGMRISPYGAFNHTGVFPDVETQFLGLATALSAIGILYLHLVNHESMGAPAIPRTFSKALRKAFTGKFIASGGFDAAMAESALQRGEADLVAFGRAAIANPDLVRRMEEQLPLSPADPATFYTPGPVGYTDYATATAAGSGAGHDNRHDASELFPRAASSSSN
jgi:N-ethylmaleimide reductase